MSDDLTVIEAEQALPVLYQLAHSDIRWAKERSSLAVYWMLALQAGILALHLSLPLTVVLIVSPTLFVGIHLIDLHQFARTCRDVTVKIAARMRGVADVLPDRSADKDHVTYLLLHLGAVGVGAAVAIVAALTR